MTTTIYDKEGKVMFEYKHSLFVSFDSAVKNVMSVIKEHGKHVKYAIVKSKKRSAKVTHNNIIIL